ncbi:polysaccharide deacetylase family protein [Chryseolinea sp. T2]|uniref:polysaccharide deacetylase family protein n=1 Tax=Chryseolinea sp. T2 TaxID=3129255 RepID=UPI003076902C
MKVCLNVMRVCLIFAIVIGFSAGSFAQKKVSITIDDVPNSMLYKSEGFRSRLLHMIDSMKLPVAIFINEVRIFDVEEADKALNLFDEWLASPNVIIGNHGYQHRMYSKEGIDSFQIDVLQGEAITSPLAKRYGKGENYYRFPYNDLGKDAAQHKQAADFLKSRSYIITPYTVHSDDWLVTQLYEYYKSHGRGKDAERIGKTFIDFTLKNFDYIESITDQKLGRNVSQIYLMHDNLLNADYLDELLTALMKRGYSFITLDEAMKDPVYKQQDYYEQRFGVSWVYRWIKDEKLRMQLMRAAPDSEAFEKELSQLKK